MRRINIIMMLPIVARYFANWRQQSALFASRGWETKKKESRRSRMITTTITPSMICQRRRLLKQCELSYSISLLLSNQQRLCLHPRTNSNNLRRTMMVASGTDVHEHECTPTSCNAATAAALASSCGISVYGKGECFASSTIAAAVAPTTSNKSYYHCNDLRLVHHRHYPGSFIFSRSDSRRSRRYNSSSSSSSGDDEISGVRGGADLLSSSLSSTGLHRKIVLESYAPSGIDVSGLICVGGEKNYYNTSSNIDLTAKNENEEYGDLPGMSKTVHMNGSILVFPTMCFLWNVKYPHDVTLDSLAPIRLYTPSVQYLFLGCDSPFPSSNISKIKKEMKTRHDIVVESMDVMNAMGTFNILNGEDRRVACAIVMNVDE